MNDVPVPGPTHGPTVPASGEGWKVVIDMPRGVGRNPNYTGGYVGWLNLNTVSKLHWRHRWPIERAWRKAAAAALKRKRLPKGLTRVRVQVELRFPDKGIRDAENYEWTIKRCIDALQPEKIVWTVDPKTQVKKPVLHAGAGLIPGDDKRYLDRAENVIGPPLGHKAGTPRGQIILHITPLQEEAL